MRRSLCLVGYVAALVLLAQACWGITYATINDVSATQLTNGIQITVKADGILEWRPDYEGNYYGDGMVGNANQICVRFPGARTSVKTFTDVSMYPVSFVQTSVPQDAVDGVGVKMVVGLFASAQYDVTGSQDRQSVIITVKSTQTIEKNDRGAATSADTKSDITCTCADGLMSIDVLKVDMLKVIGAISKASGINVVADDAIAKRTVSLSLQGTAPDDVLHYLASGYGLSLSKVGDVYMMSEGVPTDLATYRASGTQSFPMKYVRAQTASELLPTFLYSYLHVNREQNAVVVSAPTQMLDKIKGDLAKVDIAPPQIMIEAVAVELASVNDLTLSLGLAGASGKAGQGTLSTESGDISYDTIGKLPNEFAARLKALVVDHKASISASPRMAVLNGEGAEIFVGAQRFMRVEMPGYGGNSEKIQGVDVGTRISVTPWTGGNGEITTTITPNVSNVMELDRTTGLPTLSSRRASTTVRVKDGETILIGGLTQEQEYKTSRRIPLLGDLPIVGQLFRSKSTSSTKTELVILITPRILTESGHLPDAKEEAAVMGRAMGQ